ncbi:MAG TPA: sensor domain-containing diguanylate cyclase [Frateuria sp.]|uniref:sensor domain-containing diguanylate cyclase n=1 Tax=Frateuria sp. TaxID=2211372 RepID=UPI002DEA8605|nr:sensor domain-containing diguanylate cyclase [Frateuria sp.]
MIPKLPTPAELLDLMPDAVCVVDAQGQVLFVSAGFGRILGYAPMEVIGQPIFRLVHPDDRATTLRQAERVMNGVPQLHFRNRYIHKDGHSVDIQWSARWLPEYGVRIGVAHEVTELRRAERELEHRATHDPLTGLPNRHRLQHELQYALEHASRTKNGLAVLYLDLDGFKRINDRHGHDVGDRLLREAGRRLHKRLRQGDLMARIGGDEFVALLPGCCDVQAADIVAEDLRACLKSPFELPEGVFHLDASIGIACFPDGGSDPDALLACADRAMYQAKRDRRGEDPSDPVCGP